MLTGLRTALLASCLVFFLPAGSTAAEEKAVPAGRFEFALIGDLPYDGAQIQGSVNLMKDIDMADLAFVVHVGDFWGDGIIWKKNTRGLPPCSDEAMQNSLELAQNSRHPFIFTPGDNDWADCHRAKPRSYDPLERLATLRKLFFQGDVSLGQRRIHLVRQSKDSRYARFSENVRWTYGGVQFVTIHMIGSNNNLGRTPEMDAEYAERNAANLVWMRQAFELARRNGSRAIVIIAHANPQFENNWSARLQKRYLLGGLGITPPGERRTTGFDEFLGELEDETLAFGKPVVYLHGDTHTYRVDKPLVGSSTRRIIENFTRVETFGWPDSHWLRISVDAADPNVFSFRQQIVKENRAEH